MGKSRRGAKRKVAVETYDSDDERAYSKERVPDPNSASYYHDEIDEFHQARDKMLLDKGAEVYDKKYASSEEEVLGLESEEEDNDDVISGFEDQLRKMRGHSVREQLASDLEDESDGDLDVNAWGKQKSKFYGADNQDDRKKKRKTSKKSAASDSEDVDPDELEEREALAIQRRHAEQLTDDDFGLDLLQAVQDVSERNDSEEVIVKDVSNLTKQEKLQLVKKESPELLSIVEDYKEKLSELHERLLPLLSCYQQGLLHPSTGVSYILTMAQLYTDYCTNISFYLMLKFKRLPIRDHPVIRRIVEYRNMIKRLEVAGGGVQPMVDKLLVKMKAGELQRVREPVERIDVLDIVRPLVVDAKKTRKYKATDSMLAAADQLAAEDEEQLEEEDGDGRRAIDYTIAKNKGLKPRRKKEYRNPRVKHRIKYRKAIINRRGQIREVQTEKTKYGGEASGIRAGVKKSIKLKV